MLLDSGTLNWQTPSLPMPQCPADRKQLDWSLNSHALQPEGR